MPAGPDGRGGPGHDERVGVGRRLAQRHDVRQRLALGPAPGATRRQRRFELPRRDGDEWSRVYLYNRILRRFESRAAAQGCRHAYLYTFSFQARGFYERLGYTCFGELPNYPVGSRYFMKKTLTAV